DGFIAVAPFASRFPFEVWILPKKHSCDFVSLSDPSRRDLAKILKVVLGKLKAALGDPPFNYIIHTAPFRRQKSGYWRTIEEDYHWHIEIMPRLTRVAGFEWGTGFYICPLPPESAAEFLRETNVNEVTT
ncbi:MAG: galactose-1-phosphate uridylyltransferase, partial [Candidatus Omnitrophica bacterium]|nr:galactose-1-phosphate uridylyltransferase [Candidatus Omnitrophota bacterium]